MSERKEQDTHATPPQPPDIDARVSLPPFHWVGLLVLFALPLLALVGVFGESKARVELQNDTLALDLSYYDRFRYKLLNPIEMEITNRSGQPLERLLIRFDPAYIDQFSTVVFKPDLKEVYTVELTDIQPGESRQVRVELQGERYGLHQGTITLEPSTGESLEVPIETLIYP